MFLSHLFTLSNGLQPPSQSQTQIIQTEQSEIEFLNEFYTSSSFSNKTNNNSIHSEFNEIENSIQRSKSKNKSDQNKNKIKTKRIENLSEDLKDCEVYIHLISQNFKDLIPFSSFCNETNLELRFLRVLDFAKSHSIIPPSLVSSSLSSRLALGEVSSNLLLLNQVQNSLNLRQKKNSSNSETSTKINSIAAQILKIESNSWKDIKHKIYEKINANPKFENLSFLIFSGEDIKYVNTSELMMGWVNYILHKNSGNLISLSWNVSKIQNLNLDLENCKIYLILIAACQPSLNLNLKEYFNHPHSDPSYLKQILLNLLVKIDLIPNSNVLKDILFTENSADDKIDEKKWKINLSLLVELFLKYQHTIDDIPNKIIYKRHIYHSFISNSLALNVYDLLIDNNNNIIDFTPQNLLSKLSNGVYLIQLMNKSFSFSPVIDSRVYHKNPITISQVAENWHIILNALRTITGNPLVQFYPNATTAQGGSNSSNLDDILLGKPWVLENLIKFVVESCLLDEISAIRHPELFVTLEQGEDFAVLNNLSVGELMMRWMNYHLEECDVENNCVKNFVQNCSDGIFYLLLFQELCPEIELNLDEEDFGEFDADDNENSEDNDDDDINSNSGEEDKSPEENNNNNNDNKLSSEEKNRKRMEKVIEIARDVLKVKVVPSVESLTNAKKENNNVHGNSIHIYFLAGIFRERTGLAEKEEIGEELKEQVGIDSVFLDQISEQISEAKFFNLFFSFSLFNNSNSNSTNNSNVINMNINNINIHFNFNFNNSDLFLIFKNNPKSILLFLEKLFPNSIDSKKLNSLFNSSTSSSTSSSSSTSNKSTNIDSESSTNTFQKLEIFNSIIEICKKIGIKNISTLSGKELMEGNKKVVLSFMGQIWKFYCSKKCGGEPEIVKWINSSNTEQKNREKIGGIEDRKIGKGVVIAEVMERKGIKVEWKQVKSGTNWEEREENARYVTSLAWREGLKVWMTWQSIVKVRPGILLAFLSSFLI